MVKANVSQQTLLQGIGIAEGKRELRSFRPFPGKALRTGKDCLCDSVLLQLLNSQGHKICLKICLSPSYLSPNHNTCHPYIKN